MTFPGGPNINSRSVPAMSRPCVRRVNRKLRLRGLVISETHYEYGSLKTLVTAINPEEPWASGELRFSE